MMGKFQNIDRWRTQTTTLLQRVKFIYIDFYAIILITPLFIDLKKMKGNIYELDGNLFGKSHERNSTQNVFILSKERYCDAKMSCHWKYQMEIVVSHFEDAHIRKIFGTQKRFDVSF